MTLEIRPERVPLGSMFAPEAGQGSRWLIVGPSGSGKTMGICYAIKSGWFGPAHDEQFLLTPSYRQAVYNGVPWTQVYPLYDAAEIAAIAFKQQLREECNVTRRVLVVVDDALGAAGLRAAPDANPLSVLYCRGRHLGIDVVCLSQRTVGLPMELRANCSIVMFETQNRSEIDAMYGLVGVGSRSEFGGLCRSVWRQKYRPVIFNQSTGALYCGYDMRISCAAVVKKAPIVVKTTTAAARQQPGPSTMADKTDIDSPHHSDSPETHTAPTLATNAIPFPDNVITAGPAATLRGVGAAASVSEADELGQILDGF